MTMWHGIRTVRIISEILCSIGKHECWDIFVSEKVTVESKEFGSNPNAEYLGYIDVTVRLPMKNTIKRCKYCKQLVE